MRGVVAGMHRWDCIHSIFLVNKTLWCVPLQLWLWALFACRHAGTVRIADALGGVKSPGSKHVQVTSVATGALNSTVQITAWRKEKGSFIWFHCGQGCCLHCVKCYRITKEKGAGRFATMVFPLTSSKSWTSSMRPCWSSKPFGGELLQADNSFSRNLGPLSAQACVKARADSMSDW